MYDNEDNIDNDEVLDPEVEDEASQVADPPQEEGLLDEFDALDANGQEETLRAARALIARYESTRGAQATTNLMDGGSHAAGTDPSGARSSVGGNNTGTGSNVRLMRGGGTNSNVASITTAVAATPVSTQSS